MILLVDAARLWRAETDGLFQPVKQQDARASAFPATLRGQDDGKARSGSASRPAPASSSTTRQRVQASRRRHLREARRPGEQGQAVHALGLAPVQPVAVRRRWSSTSAGAQTEAWLKGLVDNMARAPKGGDTDQIKAVASGECAVALTNTYYLRAHDAFARNPADQRRRRTRRASSSRTRRRPGTHVNIAGGAVARHAKNREAAVQFLEYLASDRGAGAISPNGNNEWPAVREVKTRNPALEAFGSFKTESVPVSVIGSEPGARAADARSRRIPLIRAAGISTRASGAGWYIRRRPTIRTGVICMPTLNELLAQKAALEKQIIDDAARGARIGHRAGPAR
ncbi:MAG: Fe(3+) ABC transporter substrate-binding protein [Comamonadaceae bacterium]|nr:Fe(3+) ABC transporter substrate-binding protein [Comamonadaceae bacterium]